MKDKRPASPPAIANKRKLPRSAGHAADPSAPPPPPPLIPENRTASSASPADAAAAAVVNADSMVINSDSCPPGSRSPSRLLFYEAGEWKDFSPDASSQLIRAFQAGNWISDISIHGKRYLVNFVRMLRLDLVAAYAHSIAWIDVDGKSVYPIKAFEGYVCDDLLRRIVTSPVFATRDKVVQTTSASASHLYLSQIADDSLQERMNSGKAQASCIGALGIRRTTQSTEESSSDSFTSSVTIDSVEQSDVCSYGHQDSTQESSGISYHPQDFASLHDKIARLDESDPGFDNVRSRFVAGLGRLAPYATVTGISRNCHGSMSGRMRYQVFKQQEGITQRIRGDANIRRGWYATSKQGVSSVIHYGFGQSKMTTYASMYGTGVYLAPEKYSHLSAVFSDVDENGEQHVVLCCAIMGNIEQVARGTKQFHPSSEAYDTGVDDLRDPKRYIVWSTHMNTHILPEYIVSFKLWPPCQEIFSKLRSRGFYWKRVSMERDTLKAIQNERVSKVNGTALCISSKDTDQRSHHGPPRSPWMSFSELFMRMKPKLPRWNMDILERHYAKFKAGRMSRCALIKLVRSVAGDELVKDSIKSMQTRRTHPVIMQNLLISERGEVLDM